MDGPVLSLIGFVAASIVTAASGAVFKPGDWYESLDKPWWRPPNWVFPVVWSILYILISVSGWLVWSAEGLGIAILVYFIQLALNAFWSYLFFGRHLIGAALVEFCCLWISIVIMIYLFYFISILASVLLIPYLVWVTIAGVLNWSFWRLNPPQRRSSSL